MKKSDVILAICRTKAIPVDYALRAIEYIAEGKWEWFNKESAKSAKSPSGWVIYAFVWRVSPQGNSFWNDIARKLQDVENGQS